MEDISLRTRTEALVQVIKNLFEQENENVLLVLLASRGH